MKGLTSSPSFSDDEAKRADTQAIGRFHGAMLDRGLHLAPSQFEGWFISTAHDEAAIDRTIEVAAEALRVTRHA